MDLHPVETGFLGTVGGDGEPGHGVVDLPRGHGRRTAEAAAVLAQADADAGDPHTTPGTAEATCRPGWSICIRTTPPPDFAAFAIRFFSTCPERSSSSENSSLITPVPSSLSIA
ncbi:hypothetical protein [Streptomyces sp. NPDC014656]|uniref:hypothetical protein n=1 Tax=Streptomyces sp. NPDC014656 TaxID=3364878 RepID=UPI0036F5F5BB